MKSAARLAPTADELREMARIAAPIVLVNLGMMLQGTVDTLMLGRVSPVALAAGAVGNLYFYNVVVLGMGVLLSLDPVVAQAIGAGDTEGTARGVQRGVLIGIGAALVSGLAMLPAADVLRFAHQPPEVVPAAASYVRWSILGVIPWLLFIALRQTLQAMHRVVPMALAVFISNALNAGLNWVFIFGKFGFRPMGVVGAAHATWISRWVMLVLLVWFSWPYLGPALRPWRRTSFALRPLARMIAIGAPVGLQMFAEGFAFGFAGIVMGWLGATTLAGHQIALTLASLTFMVPLGVSGAGAAMVGRAIGRGDLPAARRDAVAALACGVGFMALTALLFISIPGAFGRHVHARCRDDRDGPGAVADRGGVPGVRRHPGGVGGDPSWHRRYQDSDADPHPELLGARDPARPAAGVPARLRCPWALVGPHGRACIDGSAPGEARALPPDGRPAATARGVMRQAGHRELPAASCICAA